MKFKTMDDIERDKHNESRVNMRKEITEDANEILGGIFGNQKKQKKSILGTIIKILLIIIGVIIIVNLILGNIWLLRFFLKSLFGVG